MKSVTELYGKHPGSDIYIVGTGTSLRVFPISFLEDKITIGLNMAWKSAPIKYGITIVPEWNIPEFIEAEKPRPEIIWITREKKVSAINAEPELLQFAQDNYYSFDSTGKKTILVPGEPYEGGRMLEWVRTPTPDKLYLWSSISQSAINLAANMGAKNIILVGCDNCAIDENQHAHQQHSCWQGVTPNERYLQYYEGIAEIRAVLRERSINVIAISPFLKLDDPKLDFYRLCDELGTEKSLAPTQDRPRQSDLQKLNKSYVRLTRFLIKENMGAIKRRLMKPFTAKD
jgi:hypothetical protein